MKSIHKKIIRLQARAADKAVKRIRKAEKGDVGFDDTRQEGLEIFASNNRRFLMAKSVFLSYPDTVKAAYIRLILRDPQFFGGFINNTLVRHPNWAAWNHGNTYAMKMLVFIFIMLKKNNASAPITEVRRIIDIINANDNSKMLNGVGYQPLSIRAVQDMILGRMKTAQAVAEGRKIIEDNSARFNSAEEMFESLGK